MPARPMWRSPDRKVNPWGRGYQPVATTFKIRGDDKGHVPEGKLKKSDRIKTQPIGFPQGKHADAATVERLGLVACFCGRCYKENNGRERLIYG